MSPESRAGSGAGSSQHVDEMIIVSRRIPPASKVNDTIVFGTALFTAACGLVFGLGIVLDWPLVLYGSALALGLLALGFAIRRYFVDRFPDVEAIEPRAELDDDQGQDEPIAEIAPLGRRPFLSRVLVAASGIFGLNLLALVGSLGPSPGNRLRETAWDPGDRLVSTDGQFIRPEDIATGGVSTVWPTRAIGNEFASAVVLRLSSEPLPPTNPEWVVDGSLVAYSKVCTHAGCPVGLYRERDNVLFCPCHQSTFDAQRGATPTFGPTARALPQLPLGVDDEGYLIAVADFQEQVGPAFG
jgi:ubiquinol-cytochrome c reductase iron-sulfur subunit